MALFTGLKRVFLALVLIVVSSCNSNPLIVEFTDCPAVGLVRYANTLTAFDEGASAVASNVSHSAVISGLDVDCQDRGEGIRTKIEFTVTAIAGPKLASQSLFLPYFVVVAREGDDMQAKSIYAVNLSLSGDGDRARTRESVEFTIPTDDLADRYVYEVLIGFELTDAQAKYNLDS